jgi:hypothetical protein
MKTPGRLGQGFKIFGLNQNSSHAKRFGVMIIIFTDTQIALIPLKLLFIFRLEVKVLFMF